ncbi:MAG TPA: ABC transporter permease [Acidimicrobiia bacterium]|nr:ABC transporter permease [Acidimicrobiia bacterium]
MSWWRSTLLVAWREATERARSRAYIASTLLTLVIVGVVMTISVLTAERTPHYTVGVVDEPVPGLDTTLAQSAAAVGAELTVTPIPDYAAAREAVDSGSADAAIVDDDTVLVRAAGGSAEGIAATALSQARLGIVLATHGVDPAELAAAGTIDIETIEPADGDEDAAVAMTAVVLLFLVITTYGQWVVLGVLEEKTTRVVEQVVSATGVRALLAGKVIGIGTLGLAQLVLMVGVGVGAGLALDLFSLPESTAATALWSLLWFVLGFAFYAVLYAAAASLVSRSEDAQTAAMPVALVGVAAYLGTFALMAGSGPDSTAFRIVSLLPPVAPIAFPARVASGGVPLWEILLGVAITTAAVVVVVRIAARIYAGALLAQGGRIGLRRAWRAAGELAGR